MKCIKCGSKNLQIVESGPHQKLVCGDCLAFQKFLSAADAKTFRQLQGEQEFDHDFGEYVHSKPNELSDLEYLKAEILRKVEEGEEYLMHGNEASFLYDIFDQIKDLCK